MTTKQQSIKEIKKHLKETNLVNNTNKYKKDKLIKINDAVNKYISQNNSYKHYTFDSSTIKVVDEQDEAITTDTSKHIRIFARPGSANTTTIICRRKYL